MSDPFVIWTMRRTGGTTFTSLLTDLSEHRGTQHEPFNLDRKFGHVTQGWTDTHDLDALKAGMAAVLDDRPLIKHCYELVPEMVNLALVKATTERGYRHIVLDRASEVDRIVSLELAKITGAWGVDDATGIYAEIEAGTRSLAPVDIDAARKHLVTCAALRRWLAGVFDASRHTPLLVYFEEIYSDFEAGKQVIEDILACLQIDPAAHRDYSAKLVEALTRKAQKSQSIAHAVPNMDALRTALEATYAAEGFKFETARRDHAADLATQAGAPVDLPRTSGLIIDVGGGNGEDSAYYLAKGFSVIALPSDTEAVQATRLRLSAEIEAGNLEVLDEDLTDHDGSHPILDTLMARYGPAHYVKVEGKGCEHAVVSGISGDHGRPVNLSFQAHPDWEQTLSHMVSLGYTQFQMVRQGAKHLPPPPRPPREGLDVPIRFTGAMSGCFGHDLPPEDWREMPDFIYHARTIQARREEARALGKNSGWYDIHCRLDAGQ